MKRRADAAFVPLQGTKRRRDESSSDEESQSRQGIEYCNLSIVNYCHVLDAHLI